MYKRKHFQTFDALRFFAFFAVFLSHCPIKEIPILKIFSKSGGIGVYFFFVLSGFLISYILLFEKQHQKINLKNFFIRRVLRIWPLFYLLILFAWATPFILNYLNLPYSNEGYQPNWLASVFFLENYQIVIQNTFPNVSPLRVMWSICIEEHFYIFWGIAFYFISIKNIPKFLVFSIIIANISRIVYHSFSIDFLDLFSNLDLFAYGAIPAYLLIKKPNFFNQLEQLNTSIKYSAIALTFIVVLIFSNLNFPFEWLISTTLLGMLFTMLLCFTIPKSNKLLIRNNSIFSKLGKYTYGLYLYHTIVINLMLRIIDKIIFIENDIYKNLTISLFSLIVSILISIASFYLFENQFIKLKKHFYKA